MWNSTFSYDLLYVVVVDAQRKNEQSPINQSNCDFCVISAISLQFRCGNLETPILFKHIMHFALVMFLAMIGVGIFLYLSQISCYVTDVESTNGDDIQ